MTVAELIAALQRLPQDKEVALWEADRDGYVSLHPVAAPMVERDFERYVTLITAGVAEPFHYCDHCDRYTVHQTTGRCDTCARRDAAIRSYDPEEARWLGLVDN